MEFYIGEVLQKEIEFTKEGLTYLLEKERKINQTKENKNVSPKL
jgi:hypothetical protein